MATAFQIDAPQFVIRSDIPAPEVSRHHPGKAFYPFADLKVGDSFDVPPGTVRTRAGAAADARRSQNTLSGCGRTFSRLHNPTARFTVRIADERGTIRIWRVA
jgi:hypothetical protein